MAGSEGASIHRAQARRVIAYFLLFFGPVTVLVGGAIAAFYLADLYLDRSKHGLQESTAVHLAGQAVTRDLEVTVSDLRILADSENLRYLAATGRRGRDAALAREWLSFARRREIYSRIRFIDRRGQELIRVDDSGGVPRLVPAAQLQNQADHYYFAATLALAPGQIYMSPFDLDVEHGRIAQPYNPTIRLAIPVADAGGRKTGILALNCDGTRILTHLRESLAGSAGQGLLIDGDGYWVHDPKAADAWRYVAGNGHSFAAGHPRVWQEMLRGGTGQIYDRGSLLTYTTLYPLGRATRAGAAPGPVRPGFPAEASSWKIATIVDRHTLETGPQERLRVSAAVVALALAIWAGISAYFARTRLAAARTKELLHKLSSSIEQTTDVICITDRGGLIEYVNPGFEQATGYRRDEVLGRRTNVLKSGHHDLAFYRGLWDTILSGEDFTGVMTNRKKDGSLYYEQKTISPLKDSRGRIVSFVSTGKDVTDQMQVQKQLYHLAFHDPLTGLPNRAMFRDRLEQAMHRATRHGASLALLFLDLDRFKNVNDSLGHDAGDRLLTLVGQRLQQAVRDTDVVAHVGGDEFTVIVEDVKHIEEVSDVARKILAALAQPFQIDGQEVFTGASIGVAVYPENAGDVQQFIKYADTAMYQAKHRGRNTLAFYSPDMTARVTRRLAMDTQLRRAFERHEFLLHYQPILAADSGAPVGVEALLRWQHPERGLLPAEAFISELEDSDLVIPVCRWVLDGACRTCLRLHESLGTDMIKVTVNIPAHCLTHADLADDVTRSITATGLGPAHLVLEITESALIQDLERATSVLHRLKGDGVGLAIDDFGTGYSSLSYLRRFDFDVLKVDREFIRHIAENSNDAALVTAIIAMAHNLGIRVVAEGVETEAQRRLLGEWHCDALQGFLLGVPMAAEALIAHLRGRAPSRGGADSGR